MEHEVIGPQDNTVSSEVCDAERHLPLDPYPAAPGFAYDELDELEELGEVSERFNRSTYRLS